MILRVLTVALAALAIALPAATSRAADTPFFAGKTITMYAGLPPGGGVDVEMRLAVKHFRQFIPGLPSIVPRNMPGAGGISLGNYLYQTALPDGLSLSMTGRSGFLLSAIVPTPGISYDLSKFSYIGSAGSTNSVLWLRRSSGITDLPALRKATKEILVGALAPRSQSAIVPRVFAKYEGWPLRVVHGYPGTTDVMIAIERGEVDGMLTQGPIPRPDMVSSGFLIPVVQSNQELKGVAVLSEIITNPDEKALLALLNAPAQIGLPMMGPPGIPADRLAVLRDSFMKLVADKDYRDEADKLNVPLGEALSGADLQKLVADSLTNIPEPVIREYLSYMDQ